MRRHLARIGDRIVGPIVRRARAGPDWLERLPLLPRLYYKLHSVNERTVPAGEVLAEGDRFSMYVRPRESGFGREFYEHGRKVNEAAFERAFEVLCEEADVVVDVGANWGYFSLLAADVGPPDRLVAFEPHPANRRLLRRNLDHNSVSATVDGRAVSDESGVEVSLTDSEDLESPRIEDGSDGPTVETVRLEDYFNEVQFSPDVLKIDVEGAEGSVLDGLGDAIERVDGMAVEIHTGAVSDFGHSVPELLSGLLDRGFDLYHTDNASTAQRTDESDLQEMDVADTFRMTPRTVHSVFAVRPDTEVGNRLSAERFQELAG